MNKGYLTSGRTLESDECLTPEYAVTPLIIDRESRSGLRGRYDYLDIKLNGVG